MSAALPPLAQDVGHPVPRPPPPPAGQSRRQHRAAGCPGIAGLCSRRCRFTQSRASGRRTVRLAARGPRTEPGRCSLHLARTGLTACLSGRLALAGSGDGCAVTQTHSTAWSGVRTGARTRGPAQSESRKRPALPASQPGLPRASPCVVWPCSHVLSVPVLPLSVGHSHVRLRTYPTPVGPQLVTSAMTLFPMRSCSEGLGG